MQLKPLPLHERLYWRIYRTVFHAWVRLTGTYECGYCGLILPLHADDTHHCERNCYREPGDPHWYEGA